MISRKKKLNQKVEQKPSSLFSVFSPESERRAPERH